MKTNAGYANDESFIKNLESNGVIVKSRKAKKLNVKKIIPFFGISLIKSLHRLRSIQCLICGGI